MKKKYLIFSLVVVAIAVAIFIAGYSSVLNKDSTTIRAVKVDQSIDDYTANYIVQSSNKSEQPIKVYEIFASWCIPCRDSVPTVLEFAKNNPNVDVVGIAYRDVDFKIVEFMEQYGEFPTVLKSNGSVESAFGISSVPQTIFTKNNKIIYRVFGTIDMSTLEEILRLIETESSSSQ